MHYYSSVFLAMLLWFGVVESPAQSSSSPQALPAMPGAQTVPEQPSAPPPATPETASDRTESPTAPKNPAPQMQAPEKNETKTSAAGAPAPQPPQQPKTEILDSSATSAAVADHDPIFDPPPFPTGTTTLVGGIISGVDRIRNHLTVSIFGGGGSWTVYFDERTHIFLKGAEVTPLALKKGERVYVDTMLDNNKHDIFARNIRLGLVTPPADAAGQIVEVDAGHGELVLRDSINSATVRFGVDSNTRISHGSKPAGFQDLVAGSLVHVTFAPERSNRGLAREILILAVPGTEFMFAGTVTFLDTHRNLLSVHNLDDDKTYDIYLEPSRADGAARLAVGAEVQIRAVFEGTRYAARQINVTKMAGTTSR